MFSLSLDSLSSSSLYGKNPYFQPLLAFWRSGHRSLTTSLLSLSFPFDLEPGLGGNDQDLVIGQTQRIGKWLFFHDISVVCTIM